MTRIALAEAAASLPQAWTSQVLARFGGAHLKVLRMDASAYPDECHDYPEGLLVLDGQMLLEIDGAVVRVGAGELYVVPAGVPHAVAAGSHGTLVILDT
ncbi:cupin domain-containing protein [Dyella sp. LX-66]|uniref:cupin domain-containing protein n=1 Tax=unclassified Dyella TaxID=2634549 RepID=UPI001BE0B198|nr:MULTISPECIES: cupin domain-containing protein [unclassified Dyella]MBT2116440.1 cupin domain-containing protein [Dyella sp. LX-1]MBT2140617.1 cupin domain-containing protein [Dyella sp. LX-66]